MKCKKFLTITLVTFLMITSISAVASARFSIFANNDRYKNEFEDTGTVRLSSVSSTIYIHGEKGVEVGTITYKDFRVMNSEFVYKTLPELKNGMEVSFIAEVLPIFNLFSKFSFFTSLVRYLPIKVTSIEEVPQQPLFKFDINVEEKYSIEDPITVSATLTYFGEKEIKICDMGLELGTLDFLIEKIITQETKPKIVHYIGDTKTPKLVDIDPKNNVIRVTYEDLRLYEFGYDKPSPGVSEPDAEFTFDEGIYRITGVYTSFDPFADASPGLANSKVWKGEIQSHTLDFAIVTK